MSTITERVQARMEALGVNAFEVDRRAGLARGFVYDLLAGKKKHPREDALGKLAEGLECDVAYLTGAQAAPRADDVSIGMRVAGIVEHGVWREADAALEPDRIMPILPDPRFPAAMQRLYLVESGPHQGAAATVLSPAPALSEGMLVLIRRARDGAVELSLRTVQGDQLVVAGTAQAVPAADAEIIGVVVALTTHLAISKP